MLFIRIEVDKNTWIKVEIVKSTKTMNESQQNLFVNGILKGTAQRMMATL